MNGLNSTLLKASALRLNFQDFFERVLDEEVREAETRRRQIAHNKPPPPPCWAGTLPTDLLVALLDYLSVKEVQKCRELCSTTNIVITSPIHDKFIWKRRFESRFQMFSKYGPGREVLKPSMGNYFHLRFVRSLWLETIAELRHCVESQHLVEASAALPAGDVIGLVGNIGRFPDPLIAVAVSLARYQAMDTVIIREKSVAMRFKSALKYAGPVSFCSMTNRDLLWITESRLRDMSGMKGLLGYAVELIELRPEEEYLRYTALLMTYGRLSVWRTCGEARSAQRALAEAFPFVALDMLLPEVLGTGQSGLARWGPQGDLEKWCEHGTVLLAESTLNAEGGVGAKRVESKCHVSINSFRPRSAHESLKLTQRLIHRRQIIQEYLRKVLPYSS